MKKILLMLALVASINVNAQDDWKNEIAVSYGAGSNTDIISSFFKGMFTGKQTDYVGPIALEYFYQTDCGLKIGAVAAYGQCKWDDGNDSKSKFYTIMPAVKYNWLRKNHFSMYSKLAAGITIDKDDSTIKEKSTTTFNFQASFVGMEFGGAFRGFVEAGLGEQGVFIAGLRYKF